MTRLYRSRPIASVPNQCALVGPWKTGPTPVALVRVARDLMGEDRREADEDQEDRARHRELVPAELPPGQQAWRERDRGNLLGFGLDDLVRDDAADRTLHGGLFPDERVRLEVSQV